jgi:hypothetical protein
MNSHTAEELNFWHIFCLTEIIFPLIRVYLAFRGLSRGFCGELGEVIQVAADLGIELTFSEKGSLADAAKRC